MAKDGDERVYTQADVDRIIAPSLERIAALEAKIARLTRDSRTSSKPPSSDVIKPKPKVSRGKRKPGGQKGHAKNERDLFPPEQVDEVYEYELTDTTGLRPLTGDDGWRVVQQIELLEKPYRITEHRARRYALSPCVYRCSWNPTNTPRIRSAPPRVQQPDSRRNQNPPTQYHARASRQSETS